MNKMLPVFLNMKDKHCLVVGGGKVAYRKTLKLLETEAKVTLIAPVFTGELHNLAASGTVELFEREYRTGDVEGYYLVFACTNNSDINKNVFNDCERMNIMINVVDQPEVCNFYVPAVVQQGDLKIAVSTNGKSCALAKKIRLDLEQQFDSRYIGLLDFLGKIRSYVKEHETDSDLRRKILTELVLSGGFDRLLEEACTLDYKDYLEKLYSSIKGT